MKKIHFNSFLLGVTAFLLFSSPQRGLSATLDFESLTDGDGVTNQFAGVSFSNATIFTAGVSLNEFEFPPKSGSNVVIDDNGPLSLTFVFPILSFSGFFTYAVPITVSAFDTGANLLGSISSTYGSNLALSGDIASNPNEFLQLAGLGNITKITVTGDPAGFSFVVDDVQFNAVPEPGTLALFSSALVFLAVRRLSHVWQR